MLLESAADTASVAMSVVMAVVMAMVMATVMAMAMDLMMVTDLMEYSDTDLSVDLTADTCMAVLSHITKYVWDTYYLTVDDNILKALAFDLDSQVQTFSHSEL